MKHKKNNPIFIQGKKIILRPLNKEIDLKLCWEWVNNPEIRNFLLIPFPSTKHMEEKWFDENETKDDVVLAIETLKDREFIGTMGLHRINWINRVATTGTLIGKKEYWGRGYGTDAKMFLLNYAFNTLNLRKIKSEVVIYNKRSLQYSLHCGYKIEGKRIKEQFKNGKYHDLILLGLFKEDWLPVWEHYQKTGNIK